MARARDLAADDGWRCWLCGGDIDPDAPAGSRHSATVDHVVPRSRGGGSERANLRLAHRVCNQRRADDLPELAWPSELAPLDSTPLWAAVARAVRHPGRAEQVAAFGTEDRARQASAWAVEQACALVGGSWVGEVHPVGTGHVHAVWLSLLGGAASPGRPKVGDDRDGRNRQRRPGRRR